MVRKNRTRIKLSCGQGMWSRFVICGQGLLASNNIVAGYIGSACGMATVAERCPVWSPVRTGRHAQHNETKCLTLLYFVGK